MFYVGLSLWAGRLGFDMPWYKVSMPVAFLVASAVSLLIGRGKFDSRVESYARGMGAPNIMIMCLIFILAGAFATIAKGAGAVDAAVSIAQALVPAKLMVAGVFLVSCLISLAIGVVMVLSASFASAYYDLQGETGHKSAYYFTRQSIFAFAGVGVMLAC